MKLFAVVALVVLFLGAAGTIWIQAGKNATMRADIKSYKVDIAQLKLDKKALVLVRKQNIKLVRRAEYAEKLFAKVKDHTGCFRAPIPLTAAIGLWHLFQEITGESRPPPVREGYDGLPEGTYNSRELSHSPRKAMGRDSQTQYAA